jgi:hypothetical protein
MQLLQFAAAALGLFVLMSPGICQDLVMRLALGISLNRADDVLRTAETTWSNARAAQDLFRAYSDAVHDTYPTLAQAFVAPDLGAGLRSTAYWNLLPIGGTRAELGFFTDPAVAANVMRAHRAENQALSIGRRRRS